MEGIPSTSRGTPMVFTGTGSTTTSNKPQQGIRVKENVQLVPPRDGHVEQKASYASILKKD